MGIFIDKAIGFHEDHRPIKRVALYP